MPPEELSPSQFGLFLEQARVPEHSVQFMTSMSGGRPLLQDSYLFFHADKWLLAVGYPMHPDKVGSCPEGFDQALRQVRNYTKAHDCWAISPQWPKRLRPHRVNQDEYYILHASRAVPNRLSRLADQAARMAGLSRVGMQNILRRTGISPADYHQHEQDLS